MNKLLSMIIAATFAAVSVSALAQEKKDEMKKEPAKSEAAAKKAPAKSEVAAKKAPAKSEAAKKTQKKTADTKKKAEEAPVKK